MGQRNPSLSPPCQRIQGTQDHQKKISNRQKYTESNDHQGSRDTDEHQEHVRKISSLHSIRPSKEDHHGIHVESSTSDNSSRRNGNGTAHQRSRTNDSLEPGNETAKPDHDHEDSMGRVKTPRFNRLRDTRKVLHQGIRSGSSTLLQVPEVQPYVKHMSCKTGHMWSMRGLPPDQSMRGQEKRQRDNQTEVSQLQRRPLNSEHKVPIPQRGHSEKETSPTNDSSRTSQVSMDKETSYQTTNTHDTQTTQPVPYATTTTIDGRLPRHTTHIREHSKSYTSRYVKQSTSGTSQRDSQIAPQARATHSTEEAPSLRRLETGRKNHSQPTAAEPSSSSAATTQTRDSTPRASTFNKSARGNRQTPGTSPRNNNTGLSNDSKRHSSNQPANHDNAAPANVPDGRNSAQSVYSQHNEGNITEHERHHSKVRIMHWNAQGLNNSAKQSGLVAALQLDHIDIAMIQDSRISAKSDGKPPIRVPNCHTYFIPASEECHGLLTIVRNNLPSKISPPIATSEGTEVLTVKVWIDKKPTLLHNIYRVRGETSFTEILSGRLPSILAGDFNAHHTLWCRSTDGPGRTLLDQIENANSYAIMNKPQIPTTKYNTTIDLTIVHTSIAAISEWSIYDDLISDHHPIILTIQTDYTPPITNPTPRWCLHKAGRLGHIQSKTCRTMYNN